MTRINRLHSTRLNLKINPRIITKAAANKWILELCSKINRVLRPLKANLKLRNLDPGENLPEFITGYIHLKNFKFKGS
jgi:hypothetical protein